MKKFINPFRFKLDSDRDGVWDWKDCRPFDPRRQHVGKSELTIEDKDDLSRINDAALLRYPNKNQMATLITKALIEFFAHPDKHKMNVDPRFQKFQEMENLFINRYKRNSVTPQDMQVSWYSANDYILDVFDPVYDVHHYVYMIGKKSVANPGTPSILISITSLDRERMGEREFDRLIKGLRSSMIRVINTSIKKPSSDYPSFAMKGGY